eukprot:m.89752 g.89752  ORF g.89752 m.89752 type:complete len:202 (+) comp13672_c0_seq2:2369-2974(+)
MWQYLWAHIVFHTVRMFPRAHRLAIRIVLLAASAMLVAIPIIVMRLPHSSDYCKQDLMSTAVAMEVFIIFMFGFVVVFSVQEPLLPRLPVVFHAYGAACTLFTIVLAVIVSGADTCRATTPELHSLLLVALIAGFVSIAVVAVLAVLWIIDWYRPGSVLDSKGKRGLMYELTQIFPCLWVVGENAVSGAREECERPMKVKV